jgi:hypothetical protein
MGTIAVQVPAGASFAVSAAIMKALGGQLDTLTGSTIRCVAKANLNTPDSAAVFNKQTPHADIQIGPPDGFVILTVRSTETVGRSGTSYTVFWWVTAPDGNTYLPGQTIVNIL